MNSMSPYYRQRASDYSPSGAGLYGISTGGMNIPIGFSQNGNFSQFSLGSYPVGFTSRLNRLSAGEWPNSIGFPGADQRYGPSNEMGIDMPSPSGGRYVGQRQRQMGGGGGSSVGVEQQPYLAGAGAGPATVRDPYARNYTGGVPGYGGAGAW